MCCTDCYQWASLVSVSIYCALAYTQSLTISNCMEVARIVSTMQASKAALALFKYGQDEAAKRGLLLVDTKYEFGKDADGNIMLIDEIHTPDSSR